MVMLHHVEERFEHSRSKGYIRPIQPLQEPFLRVEPEVAEFVEVIRGSLHHRFQNNSEKFSRSLKTFHNRESKNDHARVGSGLPRGQNSLNHK